MLPKRPQRADTETLIWEYLDRQASPTRLGKLQERLRTRKADREKFIESSMLHNLLCEYFRCESAEEHLVYRPAEARQQDITDAEPKRRRRRKHSAA